MKKSLIVLAFASLLGASAMAAETVTAPAAPVKANATAKSAKAHKHTTKTKSAKTHKHGSVKAASAQ
ncbi:hypothetical protein JJ685_15275 [Ramlibacter monticola]|uniref:Acid-shock protein n=1 Tax=Ramlibacter monticola TaxID=1926872 RepID=A0A936Z2E8_9BURK|nr:hypothetical protein [Ramlibacter monticola]MBL0392500.1 hypothetical protein [Ramlibacter monticola]